MKTNMNAYHDPEYLKKHPQLRNKEHASDKSQEWTVEMVNDWGCDNRSVARIIVEAHKEALSAEREITDKVRREHDWQVKLRWNVEKAMASTNLEIQQLREKLSAAEAQDKRHMEKAHKEVMLERRQLAAAQAARERTSKSSSKK